MSVSGIGTLTVLTPVRPGAEEELRQELRALPQGDRSPAAGVPGTHVARWTVIALRDRRERRIENGHFLLFAAWFDGSPKQYVEGLRTGMRGWADRIWARCDGYPGTDDATAFSEYLFDHAHEPDLPFAAYPSATLDQVRDALELRRRLTDFACRAQSLDTLSLHREWMKEFTG